MDALTVTDKRAAGFLWIDNTVLRDYGPKIGAYGIAVYAVLASYANADNATCWPSHQTIAEHLAVDRRTVIRVIQRLAEVGLITVTQRYKGGQTSNEYTLLSPGASAARARPKKGAKAERCDSQSPPVCPTVTGGVADSHRGGDSQSHEQYVGVNSKEQENSAPASAAQSSSDHDAMMQALAKVCVMNLNVPVHRARIGKLAKQLREAGYSESDLWNFATRWQQSEAWRGSPTPRLEQVLERIEQGRTRTGRPGNTLSEQDHFATASRVI